MRTIVDQIVRKLRLMLYAISRGCTHVYARHIYSAVASAVILTTSAVAENEQEFSKLIQATLSSSGIGIDELDDYLSLGKIGNATEPNLVRWDQAEITLGVVAPADAPAWLINSITLEIDKMFRFVSRQIDICVRRTDRSAEVSNETPKFDDCGDRATEIDLVVDLSERTLFADSDARQLPSVSHQSFLTQSWAKMKQAVLAQQSASFCSAGVATDAAAQKLIGAAGLIRIPNGQQTALSSIVQCSRELAYYLLGSIPIADPNGTGGTLSADLLTLLYRDEFRPGESRSNVFAKLQRAVSDN
jgi:hypothetical protein